MSAATKARGVATVSSTGEGSSEGKKVVKGRRGTLYHLSSTLEEQQKGGTTALDDLKIRRRFGTSRYFLSPAGILKLLVIVSTHYDPSSSHCTRSVSVASCNSWSLCRIFLKY
jgi:hypothetical protein